MPDKPKRRERSHLTREDCLEVFEEFACRVKRYAETTAPGAFQTGFDNNLEGGLVNVQFLIEGRLGSADDMFEAIRVLANHKLPRLPHVVGRNAKLRTKKV